MDASELLLTLRTANPGQTRKAGNVLGRLLKRGAVLALDGDLGSGKTVFVQGLAKGLGIKNVKDIRSPTFAIIQEHPARIPLCHVDLYRLEETEVRGLGLEEYWRDDAVHPEGWVVAVEWAQKAGAALPRDGGFTDILYVTFKHESEKVRILNFSGEKKWKKRLRSAKF